MVWVWAAIFIATLLIEIFTAELVSIWFTCGSLVSFFLALCTNLNETVQICVFLAVAVILMVCTRKIFMKMLKNNKENTNLESLIGKSVKLCKAIEEDSMGEIKISGIIWRVVSKNKKPIADNTKVKIVGIDGNKFIVEEEKLDD